MIVKEPKHSTYIHGIWKNLWKEYEGEYTMEIRLKEGEYIYEGDTKPEQKWENTHGRK